MSIKLDSIFTDHMVIQREKEITVFGTGNPDEKVEASFAGQQRQTKIGEKGNWRIQFGPMKAGGPYVLQIKSGETLIEFCDVMIGEVYVAAGQSNMEFLFENTKNAQEEQEETAQTAFRYYKVPQVEYIKDGKEYPQIPEEGWYECNPENVGKISGVAYYLAKELRNYTDVPIGIIGCHKGGTSASCWVSKKTLRADPEIKKLYYDDYYHDIQGQTEEEEDLAIAEYQKTLAEYQEKVEEYQKKYPERSMSQLKHDVGHTPWPGPKGKKDFGRPCGLYKTMFQKIKGMRYKAILWYQGEEDTKNASVYKILLSNLIANWREELKDQKLPFLVMQLPNYNDDKVPFSWAVLREQQRKVVEETNRTEIICTLGCGEEFNIHPADKSEAGRRLGIMAAEMFYDDSVQGHAPSLSEVQKIENGYHLKFKNCYGHICAEKDEEYYLNISFDGVQFEKIQVALSGECMEIKTDKEAKITSYGWENNPDILFRGASGLPLMPFYYKC